MGKVFVPEHTHLHPQLVRNGTWLPVQDKYGMLEHWARGRFPEVGERVAAWSGQVGCQAKPHAPAPKTAFDLAHHTLLFAAMLPVHGYHVGLKELKHRGCQDSCGCWRNKR